MYLQYDCVMYVFILGLMILVVTPRVKNALVSTNEKHRHFFRQKNLVTRLSYNKYMAHHYAFVMKVSEQDPESFTEATRYP